MRQINCYIPIKLRITGRLTDSQLERLSEALVRALAARISFAQRTMASQNAGESLRSSMELLREDYKPSRTDALTDTYRIPSYQGPGDGETRRVPVRGRSRRGARTWFVRKAIAFRARVGRFLEYIESLRPGEELAWKELYRDLWDELRWVSVWLVQIDRPILSSEVAPMIETRAKELSRLGPNQGLAYGHSHHEDYRQRLIAIDEKGAVAREIPDMSRNRKFTENEKGEVKLRRGAWLLVTTMVLPKIRLEDLAVLAPEIQVTVHLRELTFMIPTEEFKRVNHLTWEAYIQEFGNNSETLRLQPVTIKRRIHSSTLQYLLRQSAGARVGDELTVPGAQFFGRLRVLNRAALDELPATMRSQASAFSNDRMLSLDETKAQGQWEPDWRGAYVYTVLIFSEDDLGAARFRPGARLLLPQLLAMLLGDPRDSRWAWALLGFLEKSFGYEPPQTRPPGGALFEFVLEGLEKGGGFNTLFDQIESADRVPLHQHLIRLALATRYAGHERVRRSHELLSGRVLSRRKNIYYEQEIWLDRDSEQVVKVGQAFGDVNPVFIVERDDKRLKPGRLPAFREALEKERETLIGRILRGEDSSQYDEKSFATTAIANAAQRIELTENDFENVTLQRSMRLLRVEARMERALPRYYVTVEFVERVKGEAWQSVSGQITWSEDDFEGRLMLWRLGRAGEFIEAIGTGVLVVGAVALAWEAGLIAALLKAAGGATAVLISIGIAELIYLIRVVFGDAKLTLRGFLEAALDGYLMALGFRGAGFLGRGAARLIGTESLKRLIGGWVGERLIVGTVGGAGSAALTTFSHDLIGIAIEGRDWSGIETYVHHMTWGALLGTVFEFGIGALQPILRAGGESGLQTLSQVVERVRGEGFTAARWTALTSEAVGKLYVKLSGFMAEGAARGFARTMSERLVQVAEQLAPQYRLAVFRRVLELSPQAMSRQAVEGLEKFLSASRADLSDEAALALLNRFEPAQLRRFLERLSALDSATIGALARRGELETLAAAPQPVRPPEPRPPAAPAPHEPARAEPVPAEPVPAEPVPVEPTPAEPAPAELAPAEPVPPEPAPTRPAAVLGGLPLKTPEIHIYHGRPMVIVENAELGTQAMFRSTGTSNVQRPGQPNQGDWPLCYGVAKTKTITWDEFLPNSQDKEALVQLARSKADPVAEWVIKSKGGSRWGSPREAPTVQELSELLKRTIRDEHVQALGQEVNDPALLNSWLKRNGVKVGGDYKVGDPVFAGGIGDPVPIIIEIPGQ